MNEARFGRNKSILKMLVRDGTGDCVLTWFNQSYLKQISARRKISILWKS